MAISQEDQEGFAAQYSNFLRPLELGDGFRMGVDVQRAKTTAYDRTTAYFIDARGIVRQIFPMIIHARPSGSILRDEVAAILKADSE